LAAQQGYSYAQYHLGNCFYKGQGVDKNEKTAVWWFGKAAEQGQPDAIKMVNRIKEKRGEIHGSGKHT
jgi:TPR repeat protein